MKHYTAQEKLRILQRVLKRKKKVSDVCRSEGISRKTYYEWKSRYLRSGKGRKRDLQRPQKLREGAVVGSKTFRKALLNLVAAQPKWFVRRFTTALRDRGYFVSHMTVLRQLQRLDLGTVHARVEFASLHSFGRRVVKVYDRRHRWLLPRARKMMIEEVLIGDRRVSEVCGDYHVSRKTFYKWKKRYQQSLDSIAREVTPVEALDNRHLRGYAHPLSVSKETRDRILDLVVQKPEFSCYSLAGQIGGISHRGVQNVLLREGLNTKDKRVVWARLRQQADTVSQAVQPAVSWQGKICGGEEALIRYAD